MNLDEVNSNLSWYAWAQLCWKHFLDLGQNVIIHAYNLHEATAYATSAHTNMQRTNGEKVSK